VRKRRRVKSSELDGAIEPPIEEMEDEKDRIGFLQGLHAETRECPEEMEEGFDEPPDVGDPRDERLFMDEQPELEDIQMDDESDTWERRDQLASFGGTRLAGHEPHRKRAGTRKEVDASEGVTTETSGRGNDDSRGDRMQNELA